MSYYNNTSVRRVNRRSDALRAQLGQMQRELGSTMRTAQDVYDRATAIALAVSKITWLDELDAIRESAYIS